MSNSKEKIQVMCHTDLDGVVSYLVLCWLYGRKLDVVGTTPMKLEQDYDKLAASKVWDRIYFLDLDVSKIGDKVDKPGTVILDHHKTKATPLSENLNIVYHSMSDKFNSFVEDYYNGFVPFDKFKQNTITLYKKHKLEYINQLTPFFGSIEFEGIKDVRVGAVFCDKYVQECCEWLLQDCDVAIAVILNQKRIAVRRNKNNSTVDVSKFVQRIASGGGHEAAAGGSLTDEFIEFTKMLSPK